MRNSVKVVIDAYNGSVEFLCQRPRRSADPDLPAHFPRAVQAARRNAADLQQHIRYPEDLFLVQAQLYRAYHMDTPEVFYNREDLWQFPRQPRVSRAAATATARAWRLTT